MLFANTSFRRSKLPNHGLLTSSNAPDFPKCGCKGTNNLNKNQIFPKKVVPLQPHFGKSEAFDDVNH